ncbi:MAG: hypothetical protein CM15mP127_05030 [Gammaproteobacteria bacterium]|nr:MAG: hypothetical protein CM15mP127_05030 [Gammaproteobacteria bacterium]
MHRKNETQFKYIEYSIIPDRDEAFGWERHYQEKSNRKYGDLPMYVKVLPQIKALLHWRWIHDRDIHTTKQKKKESDDETMIRKGIDEFFFYRCEFHGL